MTNWIISHVKSCKTCWTLIAVLLFTMFNCAIPHDFGMNNNLKTICHLWKTDDGFWRQSTQQVNSSENTHGSHEWDYDGECDKGANSE